MKTAIVILNYNGEKDTIECLESLQNVNAQIIVVDNGSIPEFRVQKSEFRINLKVIRNEKNLGYAEGNNVGIKYALELGVDYVLVLNNDTIVDKNLIDELVKAVNFDEKIGIVVPKIYFAKGFEFHKDKYKEDEKGKVIWYAGGEMDWKNLIGFHRGVDKVDLGQYAKSEETEIATGCCMLIKKEVFKKVGLFDEKYFLYYEDADFSIRAKKTGYKIMFAPKAVVWHKNATAAGGSGSSLQDYYITRNRLIFGFRYASLRTKIALIKESMKLLFFGREWQKKGVSDFYFERLGKGTYSK